MLIGDPYSFAIRCDVVEAWNNSTFWINGIFEIYIHGKNILMFFVRQSLEQMFLFLFLVFRKK
ncbi:Imm42 family immunity protein [Pasteurella multocida]